MSQKHLAIISLGSVQVYIKQANSLRELQLRSEYIAYVMKTIAEVMEHLSGKIIFPFSWESTEASLPNEIICSINWDRSQRELSKYVQEEIMKIMINRNERIEWAHLQEVLDVHVAIIEEEEYTQKTYQKLKKTLHGVKQRREFKYEPQPPKSYRCKLCHRVFVEGADQVCSVCNPINIRKLLDGNKGKSRYMQSTIQIATSNWLDDKKEEIIKEFCKSIGFPPVNSKKQDKEQQHNSYNTDEERQHDIYNRDKVHDYINSPQGPLETRNKFDKIYPDKDTHHYAVIKADIDNLGKWVAGKYLAELPNTGYEGFHQSVGRMIQAFATKLKQALEQDESRGILPIYIGGDDILLFCNLGYLDRVLKILDDGIHDLNGMKTTNSYLQDTKHQFSLSVSVVVAHYKTPLANVLHMTSTTLDAVKEQYTSSKAIKNGFAFTFITASRMEYTCYCEGTDKEDFMELVHVFGQSSLSKTFIYHVREQLLKLNYAPAHTISDIYNIGLTDIHRILHKRETDMGHEKMQAIEELLLRLYAKQYTCKYSTGNLDIGHYLNILECSRLLGEEMKKIDGSQKGDEQNETHVSKN